MATGIAIAANTDARPYEAAAVLTSLAWHESHFDLYAVSQKDDLGFGPYQLSKEWALFPLSPAAQSLTALWLARNSLDRCGDLTEYGSGQCGVAKEIMQKRSELACALVDSVFVEPELSLLIKQPHVSMTRK